MSDLLTHIERSLAVDVDLDLEPRCESIGHAAGHSGSTPHDGPAAYWQIAPCACSTGLRCATAVHSYRGPTLRCAVCGDRSEVSDLRFIEL